MLLIVFCWIFFVFLIFAPSVITVFESERKHKPVREHSN